MLVKPDLPDESITACLQAEYGLRMERVEFLPLGGDLSTAVYRTVAEGGTAYFCKLRRGDFDEISVDLPYYLSQQVVGSRIIAPLRTASGQLWAVVADFRLILYPFVEGKNGFDVELAQPQWAAFGTALKRIHSAVLPAQLAQRLMVENFSAEWRDQLSAIVRRLDDEAFSDALTQELVAYYREKRAIILDLLEHAQRFAGLLAARAGRFVVCHTDIHPGNLLLDGQGGLYIVDWDYPMLAPKERDLMFVGGGQGYMGTSADDEERFFYRHYGPPDIDALAMAYYRCERNLIDLVVECSRILSNEVSEPDRHQSFQIITWLFLPDGSVDRAYHSMGKVDA